MKKNYLLIICNLLLILILIACSGKESFTEKVQPGNYTVQKFIHAIKNELDSRGIDEYNENFDEVYDPNEIYLHIVGSNESLCIPLYITNCGTREECKCFSYNIKVFDNGEAIVSPINADGTISSTQLRIPANSSCYFSSEKESIWEMKENQIFPKPEKKHVFYIKDDSTNKEIYRSDKDFTIANLTDNIDDLIMYRACSGFTVAGILYDSSASPQGNQVTLTEEVFTSVMQSSPSQWYIKIYMGGNALVTKYNLGTMDQEGTSNYNNGYYSTGDYFADKTNCKFKQFNEEYIGYGRYSYHGYGYYSPIDVRLLTPTLKNDLDIYVLIKKWEGSGSPTDEWLASDEDALYTKINLAEERKPENGCFYILGILLDVKEFYKVWEQRMNLTTKTASRTANGMHYFELENAKVIFEKY